MLTVSEVAKRVGRDPETVRRWIRAGKLRSRRLGLHYLIEESDLEELVEAAGSLPLPKEWRRTFAGESHPDWAAMVRRSRAAR